MKWLVDTSVWSLAFRHNPPPSIPPEVQVLGAALHGFDQIYTTGLIIQELLQGFSGPKHRDRLLERLDKILTVFPDKTDHIEAAEIRNACRRNGVQIGTVDAVLIQLCKRHQLTLLSTDRDFLHAKPFVQFDLWQEVHH